MPDINVIRQPVGSMLYKDVNWHAIEKIEAVCRDSETVIIRFLNGNLFRISLPGILMRAMIRVGSEEAEHRFIEVDLERYDREHGLY